MPGLVRVAQDGFVIVGGKRTRARVVREAKERASWLVVETDATGAATVRAFASELEALSYVVGKVEE